MTPRHLPRRAALFAAASIGLLAAGCAALAPRDLTLTEAELQRLVERQFPREQRVMELLDLKLSRPLVKLLPQRNRIATEVEVAAGERITGRALRGSMALDYALRYEPSDMSLRLAQVRVNELKLDIAGTALAGQATRLAALAAEHALDDFAVWRADDAKREQLKRAGIAAADIAVTSRGVELRFAEPR